MLIGISTIGLTRKEALSCCRAYYPTYSWKRKLAFLWNLLWLLIAANLDRKKMSPEQWSMLSHEGGKAPSKLFILRHKLAEKSRLYCYTGYQGEFPGAFVKMSFSVEGCEELKQEAQVLSTLSSGNGFSAPDLLWVKEEGITAFALAQSPAPPGSKMIKKDAAPWPSDLLLALKTSQPAPQTKAPSECSWWAAFQTETSGNEYAWLMEMLHSTEKNPVCFTHGDLGSENIFMTPTGEYFVIDWECAADDGPAFADTFAYWLGQNNYAIRENTGNSAFLCQLFYTSFVKNHAPNEKEAFFALAFMVARGFILALWMFEALYENQEGPSS